MAEAPSAQTDALRVLGCVVLFDKKKHN